MDTFIKDLSFNQLCTNPPDELDKLVYLYHSTLKEILNNHATIHTKQVSMQQQTNWYNEDIALAKKASRKAKRKWHSTKLQIYLEIYKSESHKVKQLCKKSKARFLSEKG